MIDDIDKKANNPIINSSVEQKNIENSSRELRENNKQTLNLNPQLGDNFGALNKDYKTDLSTYPSNQYNSNSNFMKGIH